jgi:hypothetical protein
MNRTRQVVAGEALTPAMIRSMFFGSLTKTSRPGVSPSPYPDPVPPRFPHGGHGMKMKFPDVASRCLPLGGLIGVMSKMQRR